MKVSWQVTGVRHDAWAKANPMSVEEDKPDTEKGKYIHPELYGQPADKRIGWADVSEYVEQSKTIQESLPKEHQFVEEKRAEHIEELKKAAKLSKKMRKKAQASSSGS